MSPCTVFLLFLLFLKPDGFVHREGEHNAVRRRAKPAGRCDCGHDCGLFLPRDHDQNEVLFVLDRNAQVLADVFGIAAAAL